ncbi:unknown protein [Desulfotalea psychrophila LSv54]|uniref:Uncharacterized protein n=1 Tax=Desulfotalea psychrophila (strain LSv54 / DSM 12343) TaxID=177439 RepID=Q6AQN4_DESPS|nr:unknown protein [Desulfotalea psychrophila LSv54]
MREKAVRWPDGLVFSTYYTIKTVKEEIRWENHLKQTPHSPCLSPNTPLTDCTLTNQLHSPPRQGGEAFCRINLAH